MEELPDKSWIAGKYEEGEISTLYGTVSFETSEGSFFAQGLHADEIIDEIYNIWINYDFDQQEAVTYWIRNNIG